MKHMPVRLFAGRSALALAAVLLLSPLDPANAQSTWDSIKSSGKLRNCVVRAGPPYSYKDDQGAWRGLSVDLGADLAKHLKVEVVPHETTWGTAVLDLQSDKCDVMFGLNATPSRWEAVDFAGPLWRFSYTIVAQKGMNAGPAWSDYNKPEITLSVLQGTADEEAARRYAPLAKKITFANIGEVVLAVQSKRADAMVSTALSALLAKQKNPELGDFIQVKPEYGLPAHAGLRKQSDPRFRDYVDRWAEYNRSLGNIEVWVKDSLAGMGIDKDALPKTMTFY